MKKFKKKLLFTALFFEIFFAFGLVLVADLSATARPRHQHEDLFGEEDLWLGFKAGPKVSYYTDYNSTSGKVSVQGEPQYALGGAIKFIYSLPRIELNLLWNVRTGVNSDRDIHFISAPLLVKMPLELEENFDIELGGGAQADALIYSSHASRKWLTGFVGSLGVVYDFVTFLFEFEMRYVFIAQPVTPSIDGAEPRDLHLMAGLFWRF